MATVTMRKGKLFADIFDSPETIAQAQREGYHICTEGEKEPSRRGRPPSTPPSDNTTVEAPTSDNTKVEAPKEEK